MCTLAEHGGTTQELYTPNVIWMALLILKGGQTGIIHIGRSMIVLLFAPSTNNAISNIFF